MEPQHMTRPAEKPSITDANAFKEPVPVKEAAIEHRNRRLGFGNEPVIDQHDRILIFFHRATTRMIANIMVRRTATEQEAGAEDSRGKNGCALKKALLKKCLHPHAGTNGMAVAPDVVDARHSGPEFVFAQPFGRIGRLLAGV